MRFLDPLNVPFFFVLISLILSGDLFGEPLERVKNASGVVDAENAATNGSGASQTDFENTLKYKGRSGLPGNGKHVVLVSGDEEYRSEETVVQLGRILAERHGFDCTVLFAVNPETGEIDPLCRTNIPGLDALETASVLFLDVRYRDLPDDQMQRIDDFLTAGRPIFGIRTSTHAFQIPKEKKFARYSFDYDDRNGPWQQGFGRYLQREGK